MIPAHHFAGWLLFLWFLLVLGFGLHLKNYRFNVVPQLSEQHGLSFPDYSLAYADVPVTISANDDSPGYYIRFNLIGLRNSTNNLFEVLASLQYEDNSAFLIVGQWNQYLIFRTDEEFSQTENATVFNIDSFATDSKVDIDAMILNSDLSVKVNNQAVRTVKGSAYNTPDRNLKLYLGGLADKTNTWKGRINSFEMGLCSIPPENDSGISADCLEHNSWARYDFNADDKTVLKDLSGNSADLLYSSSLKIHRWDWLTVSVFGGFTSMSHIRDVLINVLGFLPFGFFLAGFRHQLSVSQLSANVVANANTEEKNNTNANLNSVVYELWIAFLISFTLSLFIESAQLMIPSRVSSMHDLFFNSMGGLFGAAIYIILKRHLATTAIKQ